MKGGLIKLSNGGNFSKSRNDYCISFLSFVSTTSIDPRSVLTTLISTFHLLKKKKKRTIAKHNYRNRAAVNVKPSEIFFSTKFYFHRANFIKNSLVFLLKKTNREQTL